MSQRRTLPTAVVLGLLCTSAYGLGGEGLAFVSPTDGQILVGATEFRFKVSEEQERAERIDVYVRGELVGTAYPPDWGFSWEAPPGLVGAEVVAVAYRGDRRVGMARIRTSDAVFDDVLDVSAVQLYPVVTDWRGRYVSGLARENFQVLDQGREVEIDFFSAEPTSLTLALLLDISNSMKGKLGFVQEAAVGFIDQLDRRDVLSVYAFNQGLVAHSQRTSDHTQAKLDIRSLRPKGGTAVYDAVVKVLQALGNVPNRKALFLFSDGQDELSLLTLSQAVERARRSEVIIYAVGAGQSQADLRSRPDLVNLAEATGGEASFIEKYKELPKVFHSVVEDLRAQYLLSYTPPPGREAERTVEVRLTKKKYKVRCRSTYYYVPSG